jgi:sigma-B regulation protein RsbU (phosphoserine phosphatase)
MYEVIENMKSMVRVMDQEDTIIYMNEKMRDVFGDRIGEKCYTLLCKDVKCSECISNSCRLNKEDQVREIEYEGKYYRVIASPANILDEGIYSIEIFQDITEQKKLEEKFLKHYEKLKGDVSFAKQVQRKVLPEDGVYWNALDVRSAYQPSEDLGGDLFDMIKIDENINLIYIADVSGHGVRSSLLTIFLRQVIRGMKEMAADPVSLLEELIKSYHDLKLDQEQYISVLLGIYNKRTRGLSLCNAGHNCLPLVLEASNGEDPTITEIKITGMPICSLLTGPNHEIQTFQMEQGDRILFYTDGVSEAFNKTLNREFGISGLKDTILSAGLKDGKNLVDRIITDASTFAKGSPVDDMAVVLIQIL